MEGRVAKPNFGTRRNLIDTQLDQRTVSIRRKRDTKLALKRAAASTAGGSDSIAGAPPCVDFQAELQAWVAECPAVVRQPASAAALRAALTRLQSLLMHNDNTGADPHFDFLFGNTLVVPGLMECLKYATDHDNYDLALRAALCLCNISGHPDPRWVIALENDGLIDGMIHRVWEATVHPDVRDVYCDMICNYIMLGVEQRANVISKGIVPVLCTLLGACVQTPSRFHPESIVRIVRRMVQARPRPDAATCPSMHALLPAVENAYYHLASDPALLCIFMRIYTSLIKGYRGTDSLVSPRLMDSILSAMAQFSTRADVTGNAISLVKNMLPLPGTRLVAMAVFPALLRFICACSFDERRVKTIAGGLWSIGAIIDAGDATAMAALMHPSVMLCLRLHALYDAKYVALLRMHIVTVLSKLAAVARTWLSPADGVAHVMPVLTDALHTSAHDAMYAIVTLRAISRLLSQTRGDPAARRAYMHALEETDAMNIIDGLSLSNNAAVSMEAMAILGAVDGGRGDSDSLEY